MKTRLLEVGQGLIAPVSGFLLTLTFLLPIQSFVRRPILLAERFFRSGGYLEAVLLAVYAGLVIFGMQDERVHARWRRRIWLFFSCFFFAQLVLGLAGLAEFLMTGVLHLPVPALIVAGPVYRGGGLFMPTLFLSTTLLVGPAWCSFLCYIGVWDLEAARSKRRPAPLPAKIRLLQVFSLALVAGVALVLRLAQVPPMWAAGLAALFGIGGVFAMITWSRRTGQMTHCLAFCPIGFLATTIGRLSPWRMRILAQCDDCGACTLACRYNALQPQHIQSRSPGPSCTLCGDCVRVCKRRLIHYRLFGLAPNTARQAFLVLVISLHAVFVGLARI